MYIYQIKFDLNIFSDAKMSQAIYIPKSSDVMDLGPGNHGNHVDNAEGGEMETDIDKPSANKKWNNNERKMSNENFYVKEPGSQDEINSLGRHGNDPDGDSGVHGDQSEDNMDTAEDLDNRINDSHMDTGRSRGSNRLSDSYIDGNATINSNTSGHSQRSEPLEESFQNVKRGAVTLDEEGNTLTRHSRVPSKYVSPYNRNQQQQTENLLNALAKLEIGEHGELEPCLPGGLPYQVSGGVLPAADDEDYLRPVGREHIYAEIVDRKVERQVGSKYSLLVILKMHFIGYIRDENTNEK